MPAADNVHPLLLRNIQFSLSKTETGTLGKIL